MKQKNQKFKDATGKEPRHYCGRRVKRDVGLSLRGKQREGQKQRPYGDHRIELYAACRRNALKGGVERGAGQSRDQKKMPFQEPEGIESWINKRGIRLDPKQIRLGKAKKRPKKGILVCMARWIRGGRKKG